MARQRKKLQANGANFVVTVAGHENNTPIVLLHGFPNSATVWDKQVTCAGFTTYQNRCRHRYSQRQ